MEAAHAEEILRAGGLEVRPEEGLALADGQPLRLSVREVDLLAGLARRAQRIVGRQELYAIVWRQPLRPGDRSVDVYVHKLRAELVAAMQELDVDLAGRTPRRLDRDAAERADVVVTMGCGDECPYIPGKRYLDWDLPDPSGLALEEVRPIRDEIAGRVEELVAEL